eukprot:906831-Prymnesium_polylepis.3
MASTLSETVTTRVVCPSMRPSSSCTCPHVVGSHGRVTWVVTWVVTWSHGWLHEGHMRATWTWVTWSVTWALTRSLAWTWVTWSRTCPTSTGGHSHCPPSISSSRPCASPPLSDLMRTPAAEKSAGGWYAPRFRVRPSDRYRVMSSWSVVRRPFGTSATVGGAPPPLMSGYAAIVAATRPASPSGAASTHSRCMPGTRCGDSSDGASQPVSASEGGTAAAAAAAAERCSSKISSHCSPAILGHSGQPVGHSGSAAGGAVATFSWEGALSAGVDDEK